MSATNRSLFLRAIHPHPDAPWNRTPLSELPFPFSLPLLSNLDLEFTAPVTFLVGENGTGKSTLLEALAVGSRCAAIGSADLASDSSLVPARELANELRLTRGPRPRAAMFFRAEDAFGFLKRIQVERQTLADLEMEFRDNFEDGSLAQSLAMGSAAGQRTALERRYGKNPDAASHGESFLHLLQERLAPKGLYLLDEPETPLSPLRILALLRMLMERVESGCQFIIATHSPILMALPGAQILQFSHDQIETIAFDDTEHVRLTRAFLKNPEAYIRRLK